MSDSQDRQSRSQRWLERFMKANDVIHITDKLFMQKLQSCLKENHEKKVKKRIQEREVEEMEREMRLVLEGKMSAEDATTELANNPVFKISQLAKIVFKERKLKVEAQLAKKPKQYLTNEVFLNNLYRKGSGFDKKFEMDVVIAIETAEHVRTVHLLEIEEDIESGVIITQTDRDRLKYEHPLIQELRRTEAVDQMYAIADCIIGPTNTLKSKCRK